ncbi:MAG TPA: phospholipase D-like domain-containing protein [Sulfurimonas sp.]|uniref:phospholipase D-like domain-containing protein n=1 Tax=Sulfurimonas sp. TaxID=2022749 RepID=UPI002C84D2C6|nr:phospholipase D-like domain-containing protein [Sulfurimonas sp.]HUH41508.1 phospholipase D-like domain-containing protein [Sulfurimonas sp.]
MKQEIILYHSFIVLGSLLSFVVLVHMLYHRRNPSAVIAWILSIIVMPYLAMPLYFIIGMRKRKNRYRKSPLLLENKYLNNSLPNRHFKLYTEATEAYAVLLDSIKEAKSSIYISMFIFEYDKTTKEILQALISRAKEGVEIKILLDSLGSIYLYLTQYRLRELRDSGAKIEFFMPIFEMPLRNYINLRNHRKLYIFDKKKVLNTGGNLSDYYLGAVYSKTRWQDLMFLVEGKSVKEYFDLFASDWFYAAKERLEPLEQEHEEGDILLQVVPSGPDMQRDVFYEMLLSNIYEAKEKICIITPYFIPNGSLMEALIISRHKGVEITLITPKEANHIIINLARGSYMRELEENGVKIYLHQGAMLHAKAIIFDAKCVVLGSANFDNRSLFLNYEVATFVYNDSIIKEIELWSNTLIEESTLGSKSVSAIRRIFENFMRIFSPQL